MAEKGKSSATGEKTSSMAEKGESSAIRDETSSMAEKDTFSMTEKGNSSATGEETSSMAEKVESLATGEETELKKELQRVVKMILEEDDYRINIITESIRILSRLTEMTFLPQQFKCPLSSEIMGDPIVLGSGQTYDRPYIQKWLDDFDLKCPVSHQEVSYSILTPNCMVRELISLWCEEHGFALPKIDQDIDGEPMTDRIYVSSLLEKLSSLSDQKEAAKELQRLTKTAPSCRAIFSEFTDDGISRLLSPLSVTEVDSDPELQKDLITTVLNISTDDNNKKLVAEHPLVIPFLTESMKSGTIEARRNAAATLFALSALDSNKFIIGNSGALAPLLELLRVGHPLAMKDAASAIFNLCTVDENLAKFTEIGAVDVILQKIDDGILVDELLGLLELISEHQDANDELVALPTLLGLLQIIRDSSSERAKENCTSILYKVCSEDPTLLMVIRAEEIKEGTLKALAEKGTSRARRKAGDIIARISKAFPARYAA